jgi:hypothetical protein
MAYTLANVVTLAAAKLGDASGDYWVLATLLPYINAGQRRLDREYRKNSVRFGRQRAVVTPFSAGQTTLTRSTPQPLPADFLEPYEIWEKNVGDPDTGYVLLAFVKDQMPDIAAGPTLIGWDWFANAISFGPGATSDRTLRIDYQRGITDLVSGGDPLSIDDSLDAVACFGAAEAAHAVGQSSLSKDLEAAGLDATEALITTEIKVQQRIPRRRMAPNTYPQSTTP